LHEIFAASQRAINLYLSFQHLSVCSPSPQVELGLIASFPELANTMSLEDAINERVSFLKEQINPKNKPPVNKAFETQIQTIRSADPERVAIMILQKKKQLEVARDMDTIEHLYTELEALEWLQSQVVKHI
jgi:hypothetical protein